jgi:hypothetical protein
VQAKTYVLLSTTDTIFRAEMLCRFFGIKILDKYPVWYLFKIIRKDVRRIRTLEKDFFGIKIKVVGRFERRKRTTKYVMVEGLMPLSTVKNEVDYHFHTIILKNSICSIKIWVHARYGIRTKNLYFCVYK